MEGREMTINRFRTVVLAVAMNVLLNSTANADALPTDYASLVDLAIADSQLKLETWIDLYPYFRTDKTALLEAGLYQMELTTGVDWTPTGQNVSIQAELIGIYDPNLQTFTWGWATDEFPELERTAVMATRAYGRLHGITELTTPTREEPGESSLFIVGHSSIITSLIGDLAIHKRTIENFTSRRIVVFGLPDLGRLR